MTRAEPGAAPVVVDASVALKWVLPEEGSEAAVSFRDGLVEAGAPAYVPGLFWSETASALWRRARPSGKAGTVTGALSPSEARASFEVLRLAPLRTEAVGPIAGRGLEIALVADITPYDAAYVALAERLGARLWTADAALAGKLAGTEWEGRVVLIG